MTTQDGSRASRPHRGWYSRGYLPHLDDPSRIQMITFRLADSLPRARVEAMLEELAAKAAKDCCTADDRASEQRQRLEELLDAGYGSRLLGRADIADLVEKTLLYFDQVRYRLLAWMVMPNHVHVLAESRSGWPLERVIHSWKSYSAKQINQLAGREGKLWSPEYFDRYIRDEAHLQLAQQYIEENPVQAGLAACAEDWRWSSAWSRSRAGGTPAVLPAAGGTLAVLPAAGGTLAVLPAAGGTLAVLPAAGGTPAVLPAAGGTLAVLPAAGGTPAVLPDGTHSSHAELSSKEE